jgi:hypothetical protein
MGSSMPGYARHPERHAAVLAAVLSLTVCTACGTQPENSRFEVEAVAASWSSGRLDVRIDQRTTLSEEARNALQHSVPLTVTVELILRDARSGSRLEEFKRRFEIRYLPLSQRFQLTEGHDGPPRTFPRLRHALADLGRIDLSFETGVLPQGEYELLVRSYLDRGRMPPPMRLPALLSSQWDHASAWTASSLTVEPGA